MSDSLWPHGPVARQAPLSMGILQARRLEWVAIPSPPADLSNQGIKPKFPALQANSLPTRKVQQGARGMCKMLLFLSYAQ